MEIILHLIFRKIGLVQKGKGLFRRKNAQLSSLRLLVLLIISLNLKRFYESLYYLWFMNYLISDYASKWFIDCNISSVIICKFP